MNSSGSGAYTPNPQYQQRFFPKSRPFNSRKRQQKPRPHYNNKPYGNIRDRRFYRYKNTRGGHNGAARETPPPGSSDAMQRIVQKTSSFLIRQLEASTDGEIVLPSTIRPQEPETIAPPESSESVSRVQTTRQITNKHSKPQTECLSEKDFIAKFDEIFAKLNAMQKRKVVNNGSNTSGLKFYKTAVLRELKNVSHKKVELQQCRVANEIMPELVMELKHQSREFIAKLSETLGNSIDLDEVIFADSDKEESGSVDMVEDMDISSESSAGIKRKRPIGTPPVAPPPAPKVTAEELETQRCAMTESRNINVISSETVRSNNTENVNSEKRPKNDVSNIRFEILFDQDRGKANPHAYDDYTTSFEEDARLLVKTEPSSLDDFTSGHEDQSRRRENATLRELRRKYEGNSEVDSDASSIVLERLGSECGSDHYSDTEYNPNLVKKEGLMREGEEEEESSNGGNSVDECSAEGPESNLSEVAFKEEGEQNQSGSEEENAGGNYEPTVITIIGPSGVDGGFKATTAKLLPQNSLAKQSDAEISDENYWRTRYIQYEEMTRRMLAQLKSLDEEYTRKRSRIIEEYNSWVSQAGCSNSDAPLPQVRHQPNPQVQIQQCPTSLPQLIPQVTLAAPTTSRPALKTLRFTVAENDASNRSAVINCLEASTINRDDAEKSNEVAASTSSLSRLHVTPRYDLREDAANRGADVNSQEVTSLNDRNNEVNFPTPTPVPRGQIKTTRYSISEDEIKDRNPIVNYVEAMPNYRINEVALFTPTPSRAHVKTMRYSISEDDVKRRNPVINALEGTSPNDRINEASRMSPTDFVSITDLFSFPSAGESGVVSKTDEPDMDDSTRIIDALNNYGDLTFPDILTSGDAFANSTNNSTDKSAVDFTSCNNIKVERNDDSILTYFQLRHNHLQSHPATINFRDWTDSILVIKVYDNEVITGSDSGFLSYFHIDSGNLIQSMRVSTNAITSIIILNTEKDVLLYIGSLDGNLHIVNFRTRKCMRKLPIKLPIQCLEIAWNTIFIGTSEGEVIRYLYRQNGLKQSNKIADNGILAINTGMDGARHVLIVAIRDAAVSICDALSGMTLRVIGDKLNPTVYSMLFYNNRIYCGTSQHNVLVYNYHDAQLMFRHQESQGSGVPCIKRLQHLLFVGCYNRQIYVYDMQNNSLITSITGPEGLLLSMEVTEHKIIVSTKEHFQCLPLPTSVLGLL